MRDTSRIRPDKRLAARALAWLRADDHGFGNDQRFAHDHAGGDCPLCRFARTELMPDMPCPHWLLGVRKSIDAGAVFDTFGLAKVTYFLLQSVDAEGGGNRPTHLQVVRGERGPEWIFTLRKRVLRFAFLSQGGVAARIAISRLSRRDADGADPAPIEISLALRDRLFMLEFTQWLEQD